MTLKKKQALLLIYSVMAVNYRLQIYYNLCLFNERTLLILLLTYQILLEMNIVNKMITIVGRSYSQKFQEKSKL